MKSKDLLNILDRVKGFKAEDVEKATNLIKKLCEKDIKKEVRTFKKGEHEFVTCNNCKSLYSIKNICGKSLDENNMLIQTYCSECGQKLLVNRSFAHKNNLKEGMIATVNCLTQYNEPYRLEMDVLENIFKDLEFFNAVMYDHYYRVPKGRKVEIIKILPKKLNPAYCKKDDVLCLVRDTLNSQINTMDKIFIMNIKELRY